MMAITLLHLTFCGPNKPPASIEFSTRTTIIHGPSDTGKSFIVNSLDFMLGAKNLKEVPELAGYTSVLLGLVLPSLEVVTLSRSVQGGGFKIYRRDLREAATTPPDETLSATHSNKTEANLSTFLLGHLGLADRRVRRNVRAETDSLSFRNIAHLCLVDETQMQSETPPALTGNYTSKTKELSVLRMMLEGEDDSDLVAQATPQNRRALANARTEAVDRVLSQLNAKVVGQADEAQLRDQLFRLGQSLSDETKSAEAVRSSRATVAGELGDRQSEIRRSQARVDQLKVLRERFFLLLRQYDSDISRLEMIREAGQLLGFFRHGTCVFCGADQEHQHLSEECEGESTYLQESVGAEIGRTQKLRSDLHRSIDDVTAEIGQEEERALILTGVIERLNSSIRELESQLRPQRGLLKELLDKRAVVERVLGIYEQIRSIEKIRAELQNEESQEVAVVAQRMNIGVIDEFSREVSNRLAAWSVPEANNVRYDRSEQDLVSEGQLRAAHGKGVRAILHAAFSLGLAQYCINRDLPHPGFVVLDSPLITYRPPKGDEVDSRPDGPGFADAFYTDVQRSMDCQVIVMENVDPTIELDSETIDVPFTKLLRTGRYGFFEPTAPTQAQKKSIE